MEKQHRIRYWFLGCTIYLFIFVIVIIENGLIPAKVQLYTPHLNLFIQILILSFSLTAIFSGVYFSKKFTKDFDQEFNS